MQGGMKKIVIFDQCFALSPKWYKTQLYLRWQINSKSNGAIINDLERPIARFQVHAIWCSVSQRYVRDTDSFNEVRDYSKVSFRMTLGDLEWQRNIFNDTKRRAVCLRQVSYLYRVWALGYTGDVEDIIIARLVLVSYIATPKITAF